MVIKKVNDGWYQVTIKSKNRDYTAFAFTVTQAKAMAKQLLRTAWNENSKKTESETTETNTDDSGRDAGGLHEGALDRDQADAAFRARLRATRGRAPWHRR